MGQGLPLNATNAKGETAMKLLLVDDSATMRRIQRTQLGGMGVTDVDEAANGDEALGKLSTASYDVVLLDWNMPVMDGITCLAAIRRNAAYKPIKVIMCTSESEKAKVMEALKAGANNYIVKPFTPEALKEKLGI
jgi:two-component system, chemotaxis family, chemotaxis protein CheY